MRPAKRNVSGLPAAVIQIGGSCWTGRGSIAPAIRASSALGWHGLAAPEPPHGLDVPRP